jgi:hypothetical protein
MQTVVEGQMANMSVQELPGGASGRRPSGTSRPLTGIFQAVGDTEGPSFTEKLAPDALEYFNHITAKDFGAQAVAFLNAYWSEIHHQAEFIFCVSYDIIKYADMHAKGVQLVFNYKEGQDLDFDIALYFYEQLNKFVEDPKNAATWGAGSAFQYSQPRMMTAIARKNELKKVDCNFDGRVSFLEYLLYQYRKVCNPADFVRRAQALEQPGNVNAEVEAAMQALAEVQASIQAYEAEKSRLDNLVANETGVKQLGAKNLLAQLDSSPLAENLNAALIKAEAKVRIATKKFGQGSGPRVGTMKRPSVLPQAGPGGTLVDSAPLTNDGSQGAIWWMNRDLEEKQKRYGRKK